MPGHFPIRFCLLGSSALAVVSLGITQPSMANTITQFTPGDLVVSTVSNQGGGLDTASPITLQQYDLSAGGTAAALDGTLTLPQTQAGKNSPISGEYGSASEGILQDLATVRI